MRFAAYFCVFGLLAGCHAFIDPEGDYLRPEDAGTPPMDDAGSPDIGPGDDAGPMDMDTGFMGDAGPGSDDAGPPDVFDAGPDQCTDVLAFNEANRDELLACCLIANDCPPPPAGLPALGCVNPQCMSLNTAGVCLPVALPGGEPCRANGQCASELCEDGQALLSCGAIGMMPTGTCAE